MSNVISFSAYQKVSYPVILSDIERQELIDCGYDPDDPDDIQEYWDDLAESACNID